MPDDPERVAKVIARLGYASRRDAEKLIAEGKVKVDGKIISTPAIKILPSAKIEVDGKSLAKERTRLFLFHKPRGVITTHKDPQGRKTLFEILPKTLPRVVSVGRLDLNTEGLILLTNDGEMARKLELPKNKLIRKYRVRAFGPVPETKTLSDLEKGVTIKGVKYGSIKANFSSDKPLYRDKSHNFWLDFWITEGKNREIRKICKHIDLEVTRLIRTDYGPFSLGNLKPLEAVEVLEKEFKKKLGDIL